MASIKIWQEIQKWATHTPHAIAIQGSKVRMSYRELREEVLQRALEINGHQQVRVVHADREGSAVIEVLASQQLGVPALLVPRTVGEDYKRNVQDDIDKLLTGDGEGLGAAEALSRGGIWTTTSGTTGRPKIVAHDPDGIDRFIAWSRTEFGFSEGDVSLSLSPMNFDVSILDVWAILTWGGKVVFAEESHLTNSAALAREVIDSRATIIQAVPILLGLLLAELPSSETVRLVISTGDALPTNTRDALIDAFPLARTLSVYGSTETNDSFVADLRADGTGALGNPIAGVTYRLAEQPDGDLELIVSTPFQALGYVNSANDAWIESKRGREFRTGDIVTVQDGRLKLVGRRDRQVKVRGVSVSLTDIEEVLRTHPNVIDAIAIAENGSRGELRISVILHHGQIRPSVLQVRQAAAARLPAAAVPNRIHLVDTPFPLTATGKTDRREAFSQLERQFA